VRRPPETQAEVYVGTAIGEMERLRRELRTLLAAIREALRLPLRPT
jgi:hypothetical protein